ncbi:GntR family transcriptional regulator [Shinella yambaruensis]|uniref:GntR family transcriptional regulator n=1 Tax=Shinella yambaruensis TaxID=415996 RepID=A0ABQ5ZLS4_9HYPH|nr:MULTISPECIES: GntR family transcriptional regulator [Shinella]CAI0336607.1 Transcriptional regulator [Rhizobiaceae bacterium]CAK7255139.1 Transcriptional regulator [Shinella sp. WSC3-e]MCJ8026236.1 GntR family transcriptional regulator [Shinella yambaruensis]MCO5136374.1 GntR family transcriptional regulator [Shinella sp.]MCU7981643.1 GntR family transcriptional regulator [Shinella yambaruensis]
MKTVKPKESEAAQTVDVTDLILNDIQTGVLAPGSWLKQIDLERRYGCGRPDVRRALDRLTQKRIVEHVPNRGYHVFEPDGDRARQVSEIRILLETGVADRIIDNATAGAIAELRRLADQFDAVILDGTTIDLYEANLAFHHALLSLCGNDELVSLVTEIRQRTSSAPVSQWITRARIQQSSLEHYEMVDAINMKDVEKLKSVIVRHIRQ